MPYPITRAYLLRQQKAFWTEKLKPIDSLTSEVEEQTLIDRPLSANQGRVLQANIESEASARTAADTAINKTISDNNTTYVARFEEDESEISNIQDEMNNIVLKMQGYCTPSTVTPSDSEPGDFFIVSEAGTVFGISGCQKNDRLIFWNSVWNLLNSGNFTLNGKTGNLKIDSLSNVSVAVSRDTDVSITYTPNYNEVTKHMTFTTNITQPTFSGVFSSDISVSNV